MAPENRHSIRKLPRELVRRQHQIFTAEQLLELGYGYEAIRHRLRTGRLYRLFDEVGSGQERLAALELQDALPARTHVEHAVADLDDVGKAEEGGAVSDVQAGEL